MSDKNKKPNIIFITSDQHNAKVLGHKGHPDVQTPNLDRMTAQGVRFDNAITQNPICTPSRVSFHSGQYCHNHGYYGLSGSNPEGLPNIFGLFHNAGYRTSAVGKIHCPEYWIEDDTDNFHEVCVPCSIGGRSESYKNFLKKNKIESLEDHGQLPEFGEKGIQSMEGRPSPLSFEESHEGWIVQETIRFMEESLRGNKPFLAHVSFPRPHQCTTPSKPFWSMYEEKELTLPPNADYEMNGKAPHLCEAAAQWRLGDWTLLEPKTFEAGRMRKLHGYLGAVSQVDHGVGLLLDWLREQEIEEETIVIYTADHGDYACEHGIMEKAPGICADAITRIPYIWHWPGHFAEGHVAREIVEAVDLAPTICALAGIDFTETFDGQDISSLLYGKEDRVHQIGVTEFAWSKSIRKGKYRLVYYPQEMFAEEYPEGFGELYNLEEDPWEMNNLYFEEEYAEIVRDLKNEMIDWLITTTRHKTKLPALTEKNKQRLVRYHNAVNFDGKISIDAISIQKHKNYL